MGSIEVKRETLTPELLAEAKALMEANQSETGGLADHSLALDEQGYLALESVGFLRVHTCRADGKLVGYSLMIVRSSLHTKDLVAVQDSIYVDPKHRGLAGVKLMLESDKLLADEGVVVVFRQSAYQRDISKLLGRLGYTYRETVYMRRVL